jgi:hypothetical protein
MYYVILNLGSCEHGNRHSNPIKHKEFLDEISGSRGGEHEDVCLLQCCAV